MARSESGPYLPMRLPLLLHEHLPLRTERLVLVPLDLSHLPALAAMLAINVLATAVKYQMNNHCEVPEGLSKKDNLPDLPPTVVLVVGAVYGAVILAVYLPAYLATRHAGEQLAATFARTPSAETGSAWLAANAERDRYRAALGIAEGLREHFERAAGILAPLITALFAAVLPELKL